MGGDANKRATYLPEVDDTERERIRLAETDLAQANEFIRGVVTTGAALRGSAITIWLALMGFAAQQRLGELGLLAAVVSLVFLFADGYHGWLYEEASRHARRVERLLSSYYDALSRFRDDPEVMLDFRSQLRAHRHGLFIGFRTNFGLKQLWLARPALFYRVLYPFLIVAGIAAWALISFEVIGEQEPEPTRVIVESML
jgi:hypothetical protein